MLIGRVKSQVIFRISEMSKCLSILSDFLFNPIPCWLFRGLFCGGETNFLTLSKTGWNFARKLKFGMQRYTDIKFQKLYLFVGRLLQFCWCQNFVAKSQGFFWKSKTFTQSNSVRAVLESFRSDFSFGKITRYSLWKYYFGR